MFSLPLFIPSVFISFVLSAYIFAFLFSTHFYRFSLHFPSFQNYLLLSFLLCLICLSFLIFLLFSFPLVCLLSPSFLRFSALIFLPLPSFLHSFPTFRLMASYYIRINSTTLVTAINTIFTVLGYGICVYRRPLRWCGIARNNVCSGVCHWRWPEAITGITRFENLWACRTQCTACCITWHVTVFFFSTTTLHVWPWVPFTRLLNIIFHRMVMWA